MLRRLPLALAALAVLAFAPAAQASRCDPLDPSVCLQPWPNDYFTAPDDATPTGLRLDLTLDQMPRNAAGKPIDPTAWDRNDGFSPGSPLHTLVPGLDPVRSGLVPITDMARYADPDQGVVVIDAATGQRHPIWAELDANAKDPAQRNLYVRPAVNWAEGHRYIVALRNLRDSSGNLIPARPAFRVYRDDQKSKDPDVIARRPHMESLFKSLRSAGIVRKDLYLAWDFTVESAQGLAGTMLGMRDDAFAQLGDRDLTDLQVPAGSTAPAFTVDPVNSKENADGPIAREVRGHFLVPCYLDTPGCTPGGRFLWAGPHDQLPTRIPGNTMAANFTCLVPRSALTTPARPSLYGHGLLGDADEIGADNVRQMAARHNMVFCATDWAGMSTQDVPNVASILTDLSGFPSLADRSQQGILNFMYLGRLMLHSQGFASDPHFAGTLDRSRLFYDGNSQGGILGGALTAVAPDFDRAVLGVPAMNYSTLLQRSVDFDQYGQILYTAYPKEVERPLLFSLIQQLWDRGEADGYAHHMTTDEYPNTPPHAVLMHMAVGDHQVANVAAEVEARTIGAAVRPTPLDPGRSFDVQPFWGIPRIGGYPYTGSVIEPWDTGPPRMENGTCKGTPPPPTTNTPNSECEDPHGAPRRTPIAQDQKSAFLRIGGRVEDTCGGGPCYADGWTGLK